MIQQGEAAARTRQERYALWRQEVLAGRRTTLPAGALAVLKDGIRGRLAADGTPALALGLRMQVAVDEAPETSADLLAFAVWREDQSTPCAAVAGESGAISLADGGTLCSLT